MTLLLAMAAVSFSGSAIHSMLTPLWGWAPDIEQLSGVNRASARSMNVMTAYLLALFGVFDVLWALGVFQPEIPLVIGITGFWLIRTAIQPFLFDRRTLLTWAFFAIFVFMTAGHGSLLV